MNLYGLDPKLREKALACKTSDDLLELVKEAGVSITDEELSSISSSGGWGCTDNWCHDDDIW